MRWIICFLAMLLLTAVPSVVRAVECGQVRLVSPDEVEAYQIDGRIKAFGSEIRAVAHLPDAEVNVNSVRCMDNGLTPSYQGFMNWSLQGPESTYDVFAQLDYFLQTDDAQIRRDADRLGCMIAANVVKAIEVNDAKAVKSPRVARCMIAEATRRNDYEYEWWLRRISPPALFQSIVRK